jgi:hypothetical protein
MNNEQQETICISKRVINNALVSNRYFSFAMLLNLLDQ